MKHIIIGTAGHVDHGKTALVKALTSIDTDRLREEKERGISIELGFAFLTLPGNQKYGIVDVPGHEKFIKHMVSGASGIDMVLLVIAADEGVMPQTREHLNICTLLGIKKGLVALTKVDMVEEEWLNLVIADVHDFLKGTFLESCPLVPVSSLYGTGLEDLKKAIICVASEIERESDAGVFRLPIDRVFTMKGFGTVVTGTLISGEIRVGEEVEIIPSKLLGKVRGIQIHGETVDIARAGQRTALNIQGVDKCSIERGNILARPGTLKSSSRLDVWLEYLPGNEKTIKNRTLVRFHTGTMEALGRVTFLDREELEPGGKDFAQLVFTAPVASVAKDRFVMRSYSPVTTIGGGIILDPLPLKFKKGSENTKTEYETLLSGSDRERICVIIERSGFNGVGIHEMVVRTGLNQNVIIPIVEFLCANNQAVLLDKDEMRVLSRRVYDHVRNTILDKLNAYHQKYPLKGGISKEELRNIIGSFISPRIFNLAMKDLEKKGDIIVEKDILKISSHHVSLGEKLQELREQITRVYRTAGLTPPSVKEVCEKFPHRKADVLSVLDVMVREGDLVKVSEDLYYDKEVLRTLRENYKNLLLKEGKATPLSFKTLTNLTRKYIIPLMEYFDATKLTIRTGDYRILREK